MGYKNRILTVAFLMLFAFITEPIHAQKGGGGRRNGGRGGGKKVQDKKVEPRRSSSSSISRAEYIRNYGIPEHYRSLINPLGATPSRIAKGKLLYEEHCEKCHGSTGKGDGRQVQYQFKQPPDFSKLPKKYWINDGYLFWSIAEGGGQFGGAMPSFSQRESWRNKKSGLNNEAIWKIILYIRTLVPID